MHLLTDENGSKRLLDTMESFNAACNEIAETCFKEQSASKYTIQTLVYHAIREKYGLSAQLTIRAIAKTCEAYKLNKAVQPKFKKHGSITYDARILQNHLMVIGWLTFFVKLCAWVSFSKFQGTVGTKIGAV